MNTINYKKNKILHLNHKLIELVKKYGFNDGIKIKLMKDNLFQLFEYFPNDNYPTDNEYINTLKSNPKLESFINNIFLKYKAIEIDTKYLDNELVKIIKSDKKNIIILNGEKNIESTNELLSNDNIFYLIDSFKTIPQELLKTLNNYNKEIFNYLENNNIKILCDEHTKLENMNEEIIKFCNRNKIDKVIIKMKIDDPKKISTNIINDYKYLESNINSKISFNLEMTEQTEKIISKNYPKYEYISKMLDKLEIMYYIESVDKIEFYSFKNYIDYIRMVDIILAKVPKEASELDKIVYISQFIINYLSPKPHDDLYNSYQILKYATGVCRDYADITKYLLNKLNVKCETVSIIDKRNANSNSSIQQYSGHRINLVYINESPYYLDNTWEENDHLDKSTFFLASQDIFNTTHTNFQKPEKYNCTENIPRQDIKESIKKIKTWESNYHNISKEQLDFILQEEEKKERYSSIIDTINNVSKKR